MFVPIAVIWTWLSGNVAGSNKRAAATGIVFSSGNIGGAVSGQIYRAEWAPRYVRGHAINLGCYVVALVAGTVLYLSYKRDNARRDAARLRDAGGEKGEPHDANLLGQRLGDLGDRQVQPSWRVTSGAHRTDTGTPASDICFESCSPTITVHGGVID
jgi:hypothetical protein